MAAVQGAARAVPLSLPAACWTCCRQVGAIPCAARCVHPHWPAHGRHPSSSCHRAQQAARGRRRLAGWGVDLERVPAARRPRGGRRRPAGGGGGGGGGPSSRHQKTPGGPWAPPPPPPPPSASAPMQCPGARFLPPQRPAAPLTSSSNVPKVRFCASAAAEGPPAAQIAPNGAVRAGTPRAGRRGAAWRRSGRSSHLVSQVLRCAPLLWLDPRTNS